MDPDTVKVILAVLAAMSGVAATIAGVARWGVVRITKAIDDSSAAHTVAAERAAAAQLAAAEKYAAAAQAQAVAFEVLRGEARGVAAEVRAVAGEVRAVAEYIHEQPSSRATGSGGRSFTPVR